MSILGYTSGGSPIFFGGTTTSKNRGGKTLYVCSSNESHKLTKNQAKSSGYRCTHCGCDLKVRRQKLADLESLAKSLGAKISYES